MIRLVASDVDGTLLRREGDTIDPAVFVQIRRLMGAGVAFCAASGRQYNSLRRLFAPLGEEIYYLSENGAVTWRGERVLSRIPMPQKAARDIARMILERPDCEVMISGENTSYLLPKQEDIVHLVRDVVGNRVRIVDRLEDIGEELLKVSAYCRGGAAASAAMADPWRGELRAAVAGERWLDFTLADKGRALAGLCASLGVDPGEVMAFGDNENDREMLSLVGRPYMIAGCHLEAVGGTFPTAPSVLSVLEGFTPATAPAGCPAPQ